MNSRRSISGLTIVEVLVVVLVLAALFGALLLPYLQARRERARKDTCINNLQQAGEAIAKFHEATGRLPPRELDQNYVTWAVTLLPYLDQDTLYRSFAPAKRYDDPVNRAAMESAPACLPVLMCPSRRAGLEQAQGSPSGIAGATGDYGVPALRLILEGAAKGRVTDEGIQNITRFEEELGALVRAKTDKSGDEIQAWVSLTSYEDVLDGLSHTLVLGEKQVRKGELNSGVPEAADGCIYYHADQGQGLYALRSGMAAIGQGPMDSREPNRFGSWHPGECNFLTAAGGVEEISGEIEPTVLQMLCDRRDGSAAEAKAAAPK